MVIVQGRATTKLKKGLRHPIKQMGDYRQYPYPNKSFVYDRELRREQILARIKYYETLAA